MCWPTQKKIERGISKHSHLELGEPITLASTGLRCVICGKKLYSEVSPRTGGQEWWFAPGGKRHFKNRCNLPQAESDGTGVFGVQYQWPYEKPKWQTLRVNNVAEAGRQVARLNSTTEGEQPAILQVVEFFYNPKGKRWEPQLG